MADPDRQGPRRASASGPVESQARPRPAQVRRGAGGRGWTDAAIAAALDISADSVGRWRRQAVTEGPEAVERRAQAPRPGKLEGEGEAHLLQLAQSTPPAGHARWSLRLLARELAARGIVAEISYETVRRTLKKRTDALVPGATRLSARAGSVLRSPDGGCWPSTASRTMRATP